MGLDAGQFPQTVRDHAKAKLLGEHTPLSGFVRNRRSFLMVIRRWSYKDDRKLMELARASKTLEEVAKTTRRSPEAIKKRTTRLGISFKSEAKKN